MAATKRIYLPLLFGLSLLKAAFAATSFGPNSKFPDAAVNVVKIFTAPWPSYTFGVFYFLILMGMLMGVLLYMALTKAKIFGDEFGGGKSGINAALAIIFSMIVVKFMPFDYYYAITIMIMSLVVIFSFWIVFGAMLRPLAGADEKHKTAITAAIIGVILIALAWMLYNVGDYFVSLGVRGSTFLPAVTIGAVVGILGVILILAGTAMVVWRSAGSSTYGAGARSVLGIEEHQASDLFETAQNERYWEREERALSRDMTSRLRNVVRLIGQSNLSGAEDEIKKLSKEINTKIKDYKQIQKDARKQLAVVNAMSVEERDALGNQRIEAAEAGITKLADFVYKMDTHVDALSMKVDKGLQEVITLIKANRHNDANNLMMDIINSFSQIEANDVQLSGVIDQMWRIVDQLRSYLPGLPARPAGGIAGPGARVTGP
ncbi:MAG: hypothetical protein NTY99_00945 [DPANN group archaeon]|nr:hypothetical protein [DPANN group archaeon]